MEQLQQRARSGGVSSVIEIDTVIILNQCMLTSSTGQRLIGSGARSMASG